MTLRSFVQRHRVALVIGLVCLTALSVIVATSSLRRPAIVFELSFERSNPRIGSIFVDHNSEGNRDYDSTLYMLVDGSRQVLSTRESRSDREMIYWYGFPVGNVTSSSASRTTNSHFIEPFEYVAPPLTRVTLQDSKSIEVARIRSEGREFPIFLEVQMDP